VTDRRRDRRSFNDAQKARVENAGVLTASGLIAGEAMAGLLIAAYRFRYASVPKWEMPKVLPQGSLAALLLAGVVMVELMHWAVISNLLVELELDVVIIVMLLVVMFVLKLE
jgi:hypothetical protein